MFSLSEIDGTDLYFFFLFSSWLLTLDFSRIPHLGLPLKPANKAEAANMNTFGMDSYSVRISALLTRLI